MSKTAIGLLLGLGWAATVLACVHVLEGTDVPAPGPQAASLALAPALPASWVDGHPDSFWAGPWASGAWFNPDRSGEGVVLEYLADGRALAIWFIWSATEIITSRLPPEWITRSSYIRMLLVGLLLQFVLQKFRSGLIPEKSPKIRSD